MTLSFHLPKVREGVKESWYGAKPCASDVCVNTLSQQCRPALEELLLHDCPTAVEFIFDE